MTEPTILAAGGSSREETAKIEIGHTNVSAPVARSLLAFFLSAIIAVPSIEIIGERWMPDGGTVWSRLSNIPNQMSVAVQAAADRGAAGLWKRTVVANRAALSALVEFENALEDESLVGRTLRPPAQRFLSGRLGAGNERVYVGRDGWLFYRPDVEYLTGPGFLDPGVLRRRLAAASEWETLPHPDPRPAILGFHSWLAAQGIALVVVPTPVKPAIHPEKLSAAFSDRRELVHNQSYVPFIDWLRGQGVLVFDPAPVLADARQSGAQFLATDTHWRPEAMELVAERLAGFVTDRLSLPPVPAPGFRIEDREITNRGDTLAMLDLPKNQQLFLPERALVRRVLDPDGGPWRPDRNADILVLGDSFSNIYSLESMGWGDSGGLVEHVSAVLGRPVDRIVQNDDGAFGTRAMLARSGPERLSGKRVVIWQFAARELAAGDWKP
jgi:alginate O-acetyltransferase complex protein AlgJ